MVHHPAPIAEEAPNEPCHRDFLQQVAMARASLLEQIECDPDMPEDEAAQIMIHIGKLEYVARCGRHLH